jgi:hypothetical protein
MKISLLTFTCILVLPLMGQDTVTPANQSGRRSASKTPATTAALKENITIRLFGTTTTGAEIDLALTGVGPRFAAEQVLDNDTVVSCEYMVSESENGYQVSYVVTAQIKIVVQSNQNGAISVDFREVSLSGEVLCATDRPHAIVRSGSKSLHLTISKEAQPNAP